ncbi:MAG: AAA family ATPase [Pleurocapsa minor HA4230-MV1]|jgi:hypothetical protein|nr:AAA family ATPase [Pleurocapsa minor HA4230-MV1]
MITLPGVAIHSKIYESSASLVYRGIREQGNRAVVAKVLKQDYPCVGELTRYRQEYEITHSLNIDGVVKAYSQQDYQCTLVILLEDFGGESLERLQQQRSDIILKLMAKNAEDRYQSAWGIKADLERCARQPEEIGQIEQIQLSLQDVSEQFQIPQKLYGREAEIEALLVAFDRIAERENKDNSQQFSVEMMLVSGYAGIGKSALVQELYKPITAKRGYFVWGKFDQFERNIPYSAIASALQKLVQQLLGEPDEQLQQWRSRLLTALGSNGQIIINVIPEVELIIGKQPPVSEVGATEAQNRFNLVFQNFVRVFCSKEHPLVIFLDDLQWIDSATLRLIELILLDEQIQYLFLIGAYRDNEVTPTHPLILTLEKLQKQGAIIQEITLAPLTPEPLKQLIAETLHRNIDTVRSLPKLVLRKTEGNPFFVNEFLRMLYSENLLTFDAKQLNWQWDIAQIEA